MLKEQDAQLQHLIDSLHSLLQLGSCAADPHLANVSTKDRKTEPSER